MATDKSTLPLAAYLRVSTSQQAESGLGMDAQRQAIRDAAEQLGLTIGAWHEDAGRSGASMKRRPGLQAALADVAVGHAGGIVVSKIDRLGRSSADVNTLVERAVNEQWRLVALDVGLDTTTPAGELVAAALAMAARFEYRRISERQREKHDGLRRRGEARGRPAAPRDVADQIVTMRDSGATFQAIADALNARGVPTVRGGATWRPSSARSAFLARQAEVRVQTAA